MQAIAAVPEKGTTTKDGRFFSFYTKGEEVFNAVSHIAGGALGLVFWIVLALFAYPTRRRSSPFPCSGWERWCCTR